MRKQYIQYKFGKLTNISWASVVAKIKPNLKQKQRRRSGFVKIEASDDYLWGMYLVDYYRNSPQYDEDNGFFENKIIESRGIEFVITKEGIVAVETNRYMSIEIFLEILRSQINNGAIEIQKIETFPRKYFSYFYNHADRVSLLKCSNWAGLPPNSTETDEEIKRNIETGKDIIKTAVLTSGRKDLRDAKIANAVKTYSDPQELRIIDLDKDLRIIHKSGGLLINYRKKNYDSKGKIISIAKEIVELSKTMKSMTFKKVEDTVQESDYET